MAERFMALVLKTSDSETGPGVRIPLLPGFLLELSTAGSEPGVWRDGRVAEGARLLSECTAFKPYRGFESLSLRF
jgi:hypothetical protein